MKRTFLASLLVTTVVAGSFATGCANMTPAQQRALSGGAAGAAGGALLGAVTGGEGGAAKGAAIGGAAGAAGGYLYEKSRQRDDRW